MSELKVVELYESNHRDAVAALRSVADQIEAGEFGDIATVCVTLRGDTMELFGMGPESGWGDVALLLQAGLMRLASRVEEHGRGE